MRERKGQQNTGHKIDYSKLPKNLIKRTHLAIAQITQPRCKRALNYLANNPNATTAEIAQKCAVGNVSDAFMTIKGNLNKFGLAVYCYLPSPPLKNRFGQITQMCCWKLVSLSEVNQ